MKPERYAFHCHKCDAVTFILKNSVIDQRLNEIREERDHYLKELLKVSEKLNKAEKENLELEDKLRELFGGGTL